MTQPVFWFPQGVADNPQGTGWQMQSSANGAGLGSTISGLTLSLWSQWLFAPNVTGGISMGTSTGVGGSNIIFQYNTGGDNPPDGSGDLCFPQFFINARNHGTLRINNGEWVSSGSQFWNWTDEGGTLYATSLQVHFLVSINFSAGTVQVYANDSALPQTFGTITAGTIDNTGSPWLVHFDGFGGTAFGDVWIVNQAIDLSVTANRRQFINADLTAVQLPSDGHITVSMATVTPQVYFHTTYATGPSDFATNRGTGGSWSVTSGTMGWPLAGLNNYYDNGPNPMLSVQSGGVPPGYIWFRTDDGYWNNNYYANPAGFQNPFTFQWQQPLGGYIMPIDTGYWATAFVDHAGLNVNFGQNTFNQSVPDDYNTVMYSPVTGDPLVLDPRTLQSWSGSTPEPPGVGGITPDGLTIVDSDFTTAATVGVNNAWYTHKWYFEATSNGISAESDAFGVGMMTNTVTSFMDWLPTASGGGALVNYSYTGGTCSIYVNGTLIDGSFPFDQAGTLSVAIWLVGTQPPPPANVTTLSMGDLQVIEQAEADRGTVTLYWSDDGGASWSNGLEQSLGSLGQYATSPQWRRLGMARNRIFTLEWSGAQATALTGVWVQYEIAKT